jgi:AcrR family transcriptional regulator
MKTRRRGRPPGPTPQGEAARQKLYATALRLIGERGYEETTLRDIAQAAEVSVGLLYRYFPSKQAVVLAFYEELSAQYAAEAAKMPAGKWRERFSFALRTSMEVLAPHRTTLGALTSILVSTGENGLFSERTAFSRKRVMQVFVDAVADAGDAPGKLAAPLGRLLYLMHLGVILWWLLDRSAKQRATAGLIALLERTLAPFALTLRLPWMKSLVEGMDQLLRDGLFQDPIQGRS